MIAISLVMEAEIGGNINHLESIKRKLQPNNTRLVFFFPLNYINIVVEKGIFLMKIDVYKM